MERQDEPGGGLKHHDSAEELGSPPFSSCEYSRSPELEEPAKMRRNDNYLPVPGEEKNLDVDFTSTKPRSNESIPMKNLYADDGSPLYPQLGPYFSDGRRRVDYVLAYHIQKPSGIRRQSSRFGDTNFIRRLRRSLSMRSSRAPLQPKEDPEIAAQEQRTDYHEDDKRFRREEFEENLLETGLELEKDDGCKIPGIGFLKIHAPWNVLCREAEFMKLKMPTKKVLPSSVNCRFVLSIKRIFSVVFSSLELITAPLHPKVDANRPDSVKSLSHPFSREKQHLLLANGVYTSAYPLHDVSMTLLYEEWASYSVFYKYQPIGLIRKYFGEKVGLYFAWLGVYTQMLIPAAIVGVIVFLYGCATVDDNIPSIFVCNIMKQITCDQKSVLFMEHWKRRQMRLNYIWDLTGFGEEEEDEKVKLTCTDRLPAYLTTVVMMCFMIAVTFAIVFGVILYRISIKAALHISTYPAARSNIRATVKTTAAIINLIVIIILDEIYASIARWLTTLEVPKTDKSFEERLIFKTFILKFVNAFTPIVYLAFFRGRLVGRPGNYLYVVGSYRMEECAHAGCLMELCIQLCITMLGKQLIQNNLFEIGIPKLKKLLRKRKSDLDSKQEEELNKTMQRHEKDHFLGPFVGLSPEYMEMIIQFGMVTLFVASFPLAPLFALLNNIIEIRLDAKKFVMELRRPIAAKAKDIGIWYNLLRGLSKVAVIVNAFVISFTSDFIPRLVYQYTYSPDGTMHGFINHTLSYFNVSDFQPGTDPLQPMHLGYPVDMCRYKDYREPPWSNTPYELSKEFWAILAARLAFVIVFQNVVMLMSDFVDWLIPDIPKDISLQIHKEKILMVELFMKEEQGKRLAARDKDSQDNYTSPSSANESPPQPRSRPISHANCC
uniref:Anoctamin n=1 Tax=Amphiprion ocellaris TaxID=80972 RepID=A0AAQ5ZSR0_AMPOC